MPAGLGAAGVHQDRHVPLDVPRGQMLSCRVEVEKQDRNKNKSSAVVPNSWRKVYLSVGNDNQRLCFYKLLFSLLLTMSMYYCIEFLNFVINRDSDVF